METINKKPLYNPDGDISLTARRMVNGDTTNLNDFNNLKYEWTSDWYRQAMNNFWIPEEINLAQDKKQYPNLPEAERVAYDKVLSFLIFLDSIQSANLPNVSDYITANEVNLCLHIQTYQECIHSQSYSYMLDSICEPDKRDEILYLYRDDEFLAKRNKYIGDIYNAFQEEKTPHNFLRVLVANYILEGVYFYSGFMFFYNLARNGRMTGSAQQIRYINRDENTHLWLFRNIINELRKEEPSMFTEDLQAEYQAMVKEGAEQEMAWGKYVIGNDIQGLNESMVEDYIKYLANQRAMDIGLEPIYEGHREEPESMKWVSNYSNANMIKTDFFEARSTAYAKSGALVDDL